MELRNGITIQEEVIGSSDLIEPLSPSTTHPDIKYIYVVISPGKSKYPDEIIGGVCCFDNEGVEHLHVLYLHISKMGTHLDCLNAIERMMRSQLADKKMIVLIESGRYDYLAIKNDVDKFYTKHHIRNGKVYNCSPSMVLFRSAEKQYKKHGDKIAISVDATIQVPPGKDPTHCDPFKLQALLFDEEYEKFITHKE